MNDRQRILERTNEGRVEVRLKGVKFGRKRSIDRKLLFALHKDGIGATQISLRLKITRSTVIRF
ncbi:transposase [Vibrio parahaemolyticus]|nr:helix-turn-helix domain-containing protein [Vibrio parahaemolyticus]EKH9212999.1 helix-turn-helix domain-containing protein [Vibrio parahaemolyticus]KAB5598069.1 helix-turn-helix domain-containing protein [Vibrio parahaemolyticus]MBY4653716.1 helix-turn-helix domain-containing protein [Vibrio parahaemolyticus]OOQ67506.1 transposase [Vibrio parahaemolyticus]